MMHDHDHAQPGDADTDWADKADWYDSIVDDLEPELHKATVAMLDAVRAAPRMRILDLACGPGHTTAAAVARGADALGIDLSPQMIAIAQRRFPHARFVVGDMAAPPPGPWDAIVCRLGAHHAADGWLAAVLAVLRPGGRISMTEFEAMADDDPAAGSGRPGWEALLRDHGLLEVTARSIPMDFDGTLPSMDADGDDGPHPLAGHDVFVVTGRKPTA